MWFSPPWAALVWSWEPTVSPISSCSMWIDSMVSSCLLRICPFRAYRALSKPTVKEELEPMPQRAGRSASWWISRPRSMPT